MHSRLGETYLLENDFQSAANEFRETLRADWDAEWTEVWAHRNLGKVFDITCQCARAVNEYRWALSTQDDASGAQEEVQDYLSTKIIRPVVRLPQSPDNRGIPLGAHPCAVSSSP